MSEHQGMAEKLEGSPVPSQRLGRVQAEPVSHQCQNQFRVCDPRSRDPDGGHIQEVGRGIGVLKVWTLPYAAFLLPPTSTMHFYGKLEIASNVPLSPVSC